MLICHTHTTAFSFLISSSLHHQFDQSVKPHLFFRHAAVTLSHIPVSLATCKEEQSKEMAETHQGDESGGSSSPTPASIHLIIKTAKDKETIDINPDATVEDVSNNDS